MVRGDRADPTPKPTRPHRITVQAFRNPARKSIRDDHSKKTPPKGNGYFENARRRAEGGKGVENRAGKIGARSGDSGANLGGDGSKAQVRETRASAGVESGWGAVVFTTRKGGNRTYRDV